MKAAIKQGIDLLARIEARAWADANNASLVVQWRWAAAHVSGTVSIQAEMLQVRASASYKPRFKSGQPF